MTVRELARSNDFQIIGKLTKKWYTWHDQYHDIDRRCPYWEDEAGNCFYLCKDGGYICTAEGGVI